MIYLASVSSSELDNIKDRFRSGGIPVFVEPDYAKRDNMSAGVATIYRNATSLPDWYRINICLDEQIEEAKRLFNDANYKVKAPVDIAEFEATMDKLGANRNFEWRLSNTSLNWIVGIVILGFVLLILRAVFTSS